MARDIPRGIEVLVKKASVDSRFREHLVADRSAAADEIDLTLEASEAAILDRIPEAMLRAIVAASDVPAVDRRTFLGKVGALMLAALGSVAVGCETPETGSRPDRPAPDTGSRPDRPPPREGVPANRVDGAKKNEPKSDEPK